MVLCACIVVCIKTHYGRPME